MAKPRIGKTSYSHALEEIDMALASITALHRELRRNPNPIRKGEIHVQLAEQVNAILMARNTLHDIGSEQNALYEMTNGTEDGKDGE